MDHATDGRLPETHQLLEDDGVDCTHLLRLLCTPTWLFRGIV